MQEPVTPPRQSSRVRAGLRLLAWFVPGISAPGFLLLGFGLTYGSGGGDWILAALFGGLVLVTVGCSIADTFLTLPPPDETEQSRSKRIAKAIGIFLALQILLVPVLGFTVASGCMAVMSTL